jgi:hypothetical protein
MSAGTRYSASHPILAIRSCFNLEGYSVGVVLRFVGFGPPLAPAKAFSRSGRGWIFSLFSRVMRVGLLTGLRPEGRTRVLSGPIFSGPVNRRAFGEQL